MLLVSPQPKMRIKLNIIVHNIETELFFNLGYINIVFHSNFNNKSNMK